ncbi:hypothetical protein [Zhihengliuella salsuginis]|uniref:SGNH hydrolase-type esterase domain-containing protein n=1 Tax=Zhihengliuella salsuginis TaxID=578222 RepID=A0ABQ3GKV2_9MICC|nr:hypothetical protein [Zhihengliuella salsuginis]GHD13321.1 hypothetical protein GCM10008096_29370 [Zhihengliuella salsuginis]
MRIAVIGNSHLGHMAEPARAAADPVGASVDFFIERTYGTAGLGVRDAGGDVVRMPSIRLVAEADAGTVVDVEAYDAFVVVAFGISAISLVDAAQKYQRDTYRGWLPQFILSEAMFREYLDAVMERTKGFRLLRLLRERTDKPIWLIPQPYPLAWAAEREGDKFARYADLRAAGEQGRVRADFEAQLGRLAGIGVQIFHQPEETMEDTCFTRPEYGLADPADAGEGSFYVRGDFYHMNKRFGEAVMDPLLLKGVLPGGDRL